MTQTQQLPDPRPRLLATADAVTPLLETLTADDLGRPTPCAGWTVADLLAHFVAVEHRVAHIMRGGRPFEVPSVVEVEDPADPDVWRAAWAAGRVVLGEALADPAVLEGLVHHPAATMPAPAALTTYVSELGTHGWDLAVALGRLDELHVDPAAVEAALAVVTRAIPASDRPAGVPFDDAVDVPEDADPLLRLVAFFGRDPRWAGPAQ
ncbi:TIGR03086 family metal-binding protein [Nocardioides sp. GY 10127]|uniref:TIGR03086 family metal-binding protein n=1 Tax=Nocardioides sp. GY 10127 TaxID=2569762 RepID=UPI00145880AD|nr:TIGR03086 family metal-binding protein [Nocardioides sp. GY 10127]